MSTLLQNSSRPLWVWIIVIVVGTFCLLATIALTIRCLIVRRRARSDVELISDEPAEKKLTLRRGRTVPAASYLSLTGSRFGLNSFGVEESLKSPSVRSKSPFEWWSNIRGRTSRLSYVSNRSSLQHPPTSRRNSFYQRPEYSTSKLSLASKDENATRTTVTEIHATQLSIPKPSFHRASRRFEPVNFSRSFTPQDQHSLAAYRNQTLSRIEEVTPRQSIFSVNSYRIRLGSYSSNADADHHIQHPTSKRDSGSSFLKVPNASHVRRFHDSSSVGSEHLPSSKEHSVSPPSSPLRQSPTTPTFTSATTVAATAAPTHASLWDFNMKQFPSLQAHRTSVNPQDSSDFHGTFYEDSESEPQPQPQRSETVHHNNNTSLSIAPPYTRTSKGNVLRKKSLVKTEVSSFVTL